MSENLLNQLPKIKTQDKTRVGRGIGSGKGKTSGRGHKGQKARTGHHSVKGFEGGQTPIFMRTPKKGFKSLNRNPIEVVNIRDIARLLEAKKISENEEVNKEKLEKLGLIKSAKSQVKLIMTNKEITAPKVKIVVDKYSEKAKAFA